MYDVNRVLYGFPDVFKCLYDTKLRSFKVGMSVGGQTELGTDGGRVFAPPTVLNFEKSKFIRKNQQLFTNGHFPAPYDPIGKTVTLTFQARSVRTHFRGVVMGSNADFNKNA